jgi:NADP-dependent 3-hydroxy acid dehydrogenase YdfG
MRCQCITFDSVDPKTSQDAVHTAVQQWGHLDGIVLNAGVADPMGKVDSIPVSSEGLASGSHVQTVVSLIS